MLPMWKHHNMCHPNQCVEGETSDSVQTCQVSSTSDVTNDVITAQADSTTPEDVPSTSTASSSCEPSTSGVSSSKQSTVLMQKETSVKKKTADDLWRHTGPIDITTTTLASSVANEATPTDEDIVLVKCRGNLLNHINYLENCVASRLDTLESYIEVVETSLDQCLKGRSPRGVTTELPNLSGLQNELGTLKADITAVSDLLDQTTAVY